MTAVACSRWGRACRCERPIVDRDHGQAADCIKCGHRIAAAEPDQALATPTVLPESDRKPPPRRQAGAEAPSHKLPTASSPEPVGEDLSGRSSWPFGRGAANEAQR